MQCQLAIQSMHLASDRNNRKLRYAILNSSHDISSVTLISALLH
jgi:hypothetical protein